jgi:hypothetical protein
MMNKESQMSSETADKGMKKLSIREENVKTVEVSEALAYRDRGGVMAPLGEVKRNMHPDPDPLPGSN